MYGYKVSNMNSKNKISVFLLVFFLLYIIWLPISVSKLLYFIGIIPNEITKNINILWYRYLYGNCWNIFPNKWPRMNAQRERKLGKFDSLRKLSFVWRTLLINLRSFRTTWWKKKKQGWVTNKYEARNVGAKIICVLCNIIDLQMVIIFKKKN